MTRFARRCLLSEQNDRNNRHGSLPGVLTYSPSLRAWRICLSRIIPLRSSVSFFTLDVNFDDGTVKKKNYMSASCLQRFIFTSG
jgi:hypothetical protein